MVFAKMMGGRWDFLLEKELHRDLYMRGGFQTVVLVGDFDREQGYRFLRWGCQRTTFVGRGKR